MTNTEEIIKLKTIIKNLNTKIRKAKISYLQNFICYLIDKCENETITENFLINSMIDFKKSKYSRVRN